MPAAETDGVGGQMRRLLPLVALIAWIAGACGDPTTSRYCTYNSDCPDEGPRFCVNGICLYEECVNDRDCPSNEVCVEGACSDG